MGLLIFTFYRQLTPNQSQTATCPTVLDTQQKTVPAAPPDSISAFSCCGPADEYGRMRPGEHQLLVGVPDRFDIYAQEGKNKLAPGSSLCNFNIKLMRLLKAISTTCKCSGPIARTVPTPNKFKGFGQ